MSPRTRKILIAALLAALAAAAGVVFHPDDGCGSEPAPPDESDSEGAATSGDGADSTGSG